MPGSSQARQARPPMTRLSLLSDGMAYVGTPASSIRRSRGSPDAKAGVRRRRESLVLGSATPMTLPTRGSPLRPDEVACSSTIGLQLQSAYSCWDCHPLWPGARSRATWALALQPAPACSSLPWRRPDQSTEGCATRPGPASWRRSWPRRPVARELPAFGAAILPAMLTSYSVKRFPYRCDGGGCRC